MKSFTPGDEGAAGASSRRLAPGGWLDEPSPSWRAEASVRRDGTGNAEPRYLPLFTGVNLIFLISSTICPSRTMPDTEVIACTTFS
jgi:hypothetical protein